jgi:hypothetical protein
MELPLPREEEDYQLAAELLSMELALPREVGSRC